MNKFCKKCGVELNWTGNQSRRKYCSFKCSNSHHNFKLMGSMGGKHNSPKPNAGRHGKRTKVEIERLKNIGSIGGCKSAINQPKRSKGEAFLAHLLSKDGYDLILNSWDIVSGYEIDIFIKQLNIAISYNGEVHRTPIYGQKRLNQILQRDRYRNRKLSEMGIKHIIVEDNGRFSMNKVLKQYEWCINEIKNATQECVALN